MPEIPSPEPESPPPESAPNGNRAARRGKLVTARYAAEYCGVTTSSIRRWIDQGDLPAYRVGPNGTRIRIDLADVVTLVVPA